MYLKILIERPLDSLLKPVRNMVTYIINWKIFMSAISRQWLVIINWVVI